jgi:hypothetical protein
MNCRSLSRFLNHVHATTTTTRSPTTTPPPHLRCLPIRVRNRSPGRRKLLSCRTMEAPCLDSSTVAEIRAGENRHRRLTFPLRAAYARPFVHQHPLAGDRRQSTVVYVSRTDRQQNFCSFATLHHPSTSVQFHLQPDMRPLSWILILIFAG